MTMYTDEQKREARERIENRENVTTGLKELSLLSDDELKQCLDLAANQISRNATGIEKINKSYAKELIILYLDFLNEHERRFGDLLTKHWSKDNQFIDLEEC